MSDELQDAEEAVLVLSAQQGDGAAFRALVDMYDRRLLYYLRRLAGDGEEAYDLLQGVWLKAHRQLSHLRSPRAFRVWLYRLAHDHAVSARRRRQPAVALQDLPSAELPGEDGPEARSEAADLVHVALGALSVDHRQVLVLRFLEDLSVQEIAEVLACSVGTVKSRLYYAKAALRRRLEELDHG